jgi:ankyrin repeat protein
MTIAFAEAVARTHGAIDARDVGALEVVLGELGNGMEPDALTAPELHRGERPLNVAAAEGWSEGVTALLTAGAGAGVASDANEDRGCLPLTFALRCADPDATIATCRLLIEAGADPERGHVHGGQPSPLAQVTSAPEVNTDVAQALLAMGCSVSSWPAFLHWQCSRADLTPELLAEANATAKGKIPAADQQRITALHLLCANPGVSKALLAALDSGSTAAVKSKTGTLPATLLCRNPNITEEALDTVLAGLPRGISVKDGTNCAGIHDLCKNPALTAGMIKVALRHDPKCCTVRDPDGRTALHLVCLRPGGANLDVLDRLLKSHPAGVREVDKDQCTPLHHQLLGVESSLTPCECPAIHSTCQKAYLSLDV